MDMREFKSVPEALDYVVDRLIPHRRGYILDVVGPAEEFADHACTLQIVDQSKVFEDGEYGLTLHLPFDAESATHESHANFKRLEERSQFEDVGRDGIPAYALRFGTDIKAALQMTAIVLHKVFEYPELTTFSATLHEDDAP